VSTAAGQTDINMLLARGDYRARSGDPRAAFSF
jgi:hypothetical protein